jgi:hypothetical protein
MADKIEQYADTLKKLNKKEPTWSEITNLVTFGDIRGKETPSGFKTAVELGMEPVSREELDEMTEIYDAVYISLKGMSRG